MTEVTESVEYCQGQEDAKATLELLAFLHRRRVGQGIGVRKAARLMGMKPKQFELFETGISEAHTSTVQRYARILGHRLAFEIRAGEVSR